MAQSYSPGPISIPILSSHISIVFSRDCFCFSISVKIGESYPGIVLSSKSVSYNILSLLVSSIYYFSIIVNHIIAISIFNYYFSSIIVNIHYFSYVGFLFSLFNLKLILQYYHLSYFHLYFRYLNNIVWWGEVSTWWEMPTSFTSGQYLKSVHLNGKCPLYWTVFIVKNCKNSPYAALLAKILPFYAG